MRRTLFSVLVLIPAILSAQSVTVGSAQEVGDIPRHDVFANVSLGNLSVDIRNSARLGSQDRFGQLTVTQTKNVSWFVGGGTSQFALTPQATAGIKYGQQFNVTAFGQTWDDGIKLAGLTGNGTVDLKYLSLNIAGTVTTNSDSHGLQVTAIHMNGATEYDVYGMVGSEVYWNPPLDVHGLRELGVNFITRVLPGIYAQTNLAGGERRIRGFSGPMGGNHGYAALRASLKVVPGERK